MPRSFYLRVMWGIVPLVALVACGEQTAHTAQPLTSSADCPDKLFEGLGAYPPEFGFSGAAGEAMAGAYGFVYGQRASAEHLARQYPDLRRSIELAQLLFEQRFGRSVEAIDSLLLIPAPTIWAQARTDIQRQTQEQARAERITRDEADAFLEVIGARTRGEADPAYIQTLLTFNPIYRAIPAAEFTDGFRQVFTTDGSGKSRGLRLRIEVPMSWTGRDGLRPNIVQIFVSEAGRGLESVLLQIREMPLDPGVEFSRTELEEVVSDPSLGPELLAGIGATELCSRRTTLDGLPARAVYSRGMSDLPGGQLDQISVFYVTAVGRNMVLLNASVGDQVGQPDALLARFQRFHTIFNLVANSLVIENRW
jgi:hypothetical protein